MFEKEAEEYFETECLHSYADTEEQLKEDVVPAFQKGAEFGYNKAKEEGKVVVEHFEAYGQCRDSRRIASLEKENAGLKDKLKNLESVAEVRLANWQELDKKNKELTDQLTKAKELIEKLLIVSCNSGVLIQYPNCKEVLEARVALEQFLMEG